MEYRNYYVDFRGLEPYSCVFSEMARVIVIDVSDFSSLCVFRGGPCVIVIGVSDLFFSDLSSLCIFRGLRVLSSLTSLIYFSLISGPCVFSEVCVCYRH